MHLGCMHRNIESADFAESISPHFRAEFEYTALKRGTDRFFVLYLRLSDDSSGTLSDAYLRRRKMGRAARTYKPSGKCARVLRNWTG